MTKKDERTKPKYETPTIVPLGELAKGIGTCAAVGSSPDDSCGSGTSAPTSCGGGNIAGTTCGSGTGGH
jgi:hypothetical protein